MVEWFPEPEYPDGDVLLVRVDTRKHPARVTNIISLSMIDPARVLYELDTPYIYMMRVEGLDVGS